MPKFTKVPRTKGYWVKELLMTILATSVSIVLTFGTAYQIEYTQKKDAQRQMAMMVIHDIDESIGKMEQADSIIREFSNLQLTILEGKYNKPIENARADLSMCDPNAVKFSKTAEQIFDSSVDTWSTIGKVDFIDNVSNCYIDRNEYRTMVIDEFYKQLRPGDSLTEMNELDNLLNINAEFFIAFSADIINRVKSANELNKRIMKISDKDLEKFTANKENVYKTVLDSSSYVLGNKYQEMKDVKNRARENYNKNRGSMYPKR